MLLALVPLAVLELIISTDRMMAKDRAFDRNLTQTLLDRLLAEGGPKNLPRHLSANLMALK